ncbi:MAG: ribosome-associated translation inhibitor RaiA [Candidatus Borkfalkiaceae bacterium]|nr:ribosome-associated translation inhibitor RaiA [Christensenellaceae bacterium]
MKIEIIAKNYQVNEKISSVIEKKVSKLDKYFEDDSKCKVYLKKENRTCKIELEVNYKSNLLRAQAYADNFYDGIDLVVPKLERQIYKHRSKLEKQLRRNALVGEEFSEQELEPAKLVKTKQFNLTPMAIDEAMEEFELLGHNFYVFLDKENGKVKVLYLRDDGDMGLIDPVF